MPKGFVIVLCLMLGASSPAFAQASPVSVGPLGTPITPSDLGGWSASTPISAAEAARDAREQGFGKVAGLRKDDYGNWIAHSRKGALIIFPDGSAFPL
ncbi:hypothetical protein [Acidisoma sp.]|uniref:hypothetical protein n=1 Tax=Acidisoma sp. TaxID=1872115 RepID=UPI003AFF6515